MSWAVAGSLGASRSISAACSASPRMLASARTSIAGAPSIAARRVRHPGLGRLDRHRELRDGRRTATRRCVRRASPARRPWPGTCGSRCRIPPSRRAAAERGRLRMPAPIPGRSSRPRPGSDRDAVARRPRPRPCDRTRRWRRRRGPWPARSARRSRRTRPTRTCPRHATPMRRATLRTVSCPSRRTRTVRPAATTPGRR